MYLSNCRPGMCYCVILICKQIAELNNQIEYVPLPVSLTLKKSGNSSYHLIFFSIFLITFFVLMNNKCFALLIFGVRYFNLQDTLKMFWILYSLIHLHHLENSSEASYQ